MTDTPLRCLIVEDDPVSRAVLERFVEVHSRVTLAGVARTPAEAAGVLDGVDLVLLDVELGDESGLDVARRLGPDVQLIVVTSGEQYALDAFHHRAADFLLKPIGFRRFGEAVERAHRLAGR